MSSDNRLTRIQLLAALAFFLTITGASALFAQEDAAADATPNFSGIWILDEKNSDDPEAMLASMRENMQAGRGGGKGRGGMRGGGMRGGGGGRRGGSDMNGGGGGIPGGPLGDGRERLLITHVEGQVEIIDARENTTTWTCDGQSVKRTTDKGDVTETATWCDGSLIVVSSMGDRPGLTQRLSLSGDGQRLYRTVQLGMPTAAEKVTVSLIYEMAD